jgi:hypothetical protein
MKKLYQNIILKHPFFVLLLTLLAILLFSTNISKLEIDASAETLLLEDDQDLKFLRTLEKRFKTDDFLVIAYEPKSELLSQESLQTLKSISDALVKLPMVSSVDSILNAPLLYSPLTDMESLISETRTLETHDINHTLAKHEFLTSPLYKDGLVNKDFTISAILIHLKKDQRYLTLLEEIKQAKSMHQSTSELDKKLKKHRDKERLDASQNIKEIRQILAMHKDKATLYLGGVQMISNDIIDFVKSDLATYGTILILLLVLVLGAVFKKPRWILIPITICVVSVVAITSALGFWGWEITVISSNFIALQLIITLSIVLHLIVRFEELNSQYPHASLQRTILLTMLSKITPTFFAIITTIAGFSSLLFSHIKPIINLGWMMSAGIVLSFILSFILFPTILLLLKRVPSQKKTSQNFSIATLSSNLITHDKKGIFLVTLFAIIFSLTGASQLIVENSFINYFKQDTNIYKGMKIIDQELGGTTPLDVVLTFNEEQIIQNDDEEEDSFEDEFNEEENQEQYWFTDEKIAIIQKVHNYLYALDATGDVRSFATILDTGKILNHNKPFDSIEIALLYQKLPQKYRDIILAPYVNIAYNQVRFSTRIKDSLPNLRRDELLKKMNKDLSRLLNPKIASYKLSNLMVIYNNMLQSLFSSQIMTLSLVLLILFVMFLLLFRSFLLTLIALITNIIPIGIIFGFMGWLHIPLDIMTITIAAIAMGIGVDDTIHYIHRFKEEFEKDKNYLETMKRTNKSIGYAMIYTSLTVIIGFSILTLSNLVPTIYFGLLTMLVMFAALISNLILLPKLLLLIKPLKKDDTIRKN